MPVTIIYYENVFPGMGVILKLALLLVNSACLNYSKYAAEIYGLCDFQASSSFYLNFN